MYSKAVWNFLQEWVQSSSARLKPLFPASQTLGSPLLLAMLWPFSSPKMALFPGNLRWPTGLHSLEQLKTTCGGSRFGTAWEKIKVRQSMLLQGQAQNVKRQHCAALSLHAFAAQTKSRWPVPMLHDVRASTEQHFNPLGLTTESVGHVESLVPRWRASEACVIQALQSQAFQSKTTYRQQHPKRWRRRNGMTFAQENNVQLYRRGGNETEWNRSPSNCT